MNVFCWLGWNEQISTGPPGTGTSDTVAELRARANPEVRTRGLVAELTEADDDAHVRQRGELPGEERCARVTFDRQRPIRRAVRTSPQR